MTKAFCVAGHTFHLEMPDGAPLWPLLTQYRDFVTAPVSDPLFTLSLVEELPEMEKTPLLVVEPEDDGQPRLDLYTCAEGCLVEMAPLASLPPCGRLLMAKDYRRGRLALLKRSASSSLFAVNNSLMNVISSRKFTEFLPESKYLVCHNIDDKTHEKKHRAGDQHRHDQNGPYGP